MDPIFAQVFARIDEVHGPGHAAKIRNYIHKQSFIRGGPILTEVQVENIRNW